MDPKVTRNNNTAILKDVSEQAVLNSLFMSSFLGCSKIRVFVFSHLVLKRIVNPAIYPHLFGTMFGLRLNI
jgi:hypothetical protein